MTLDDQLIAGWIEGVVVFAIGVVVLIVTETVTEIGEFDSQRF